MFDLRSGLIRHLEPEILRKNGVAHEEQPWVLLRKLLHVVDEVGDEVAHLVAGVRVEVRAHASGYASSYDLRCVQERT